MNKIELVKVANKQKRILFRIILNSIYILFYNILQYFRRNEIPSYNFYKKYR
jgi:hypothetical protein